MKKYFFGLSNLNHLNRFYKTIEIENIKNDDLKGFNFQIKLDNKRIKTPDNNYLYFLNYDIAYLNKTELMLQKEYIILQTMPIFQISKQIIDINKNSILIENAKKRLLKFISNDLICGRDFKLDLKKTQDKEYEKILNIFTQETGIELSIQSPNNLFSKIINNDNIDKFENYINSLSVNNLCIFDNLSSWLKSPCLAYLVLKDKVNLEEGIYLSRWEEIFQYKNYGKLEDFHDYEEKELNVQISSCKLYYDLIN